MFHSGEKIAQQLGVADSDQIQPNGVDLRVDTIQRISGVGEIRCDGKEIASRESVEPTETKQGTYFELPPGEYIVIYSGTIRIPESGVGFVFPRSSLIRNGSMLYTAVWDAGYEGQGEGLLNVNNEIRIEKNSRIGQLVIAEAETDEVYDGTYQGERLEE